MDNNSYIILDKDDSKCQLTTNIATTDYMQGYDISWVSQVTPFIKQFSKENDTVFDPFAGLGTTLIAAGTLGREALGLEIEEQRFEALNKRLNTLKHLFITKPTTQLADALDAPYPTNIDLVLTNPPYFHAKEEGAKGNIYNITDYTTYLNLIEQVLKRCEKALSTKGYIVVFSENIRSRNGNMIPQAYDICKIIQKHFVLKEERIILYPKEKEIIGDASITNRAHEYVFIARKREVEKSIQPYYDFLKAIDQEIPYTIIGSFALSLSDYNNILDNPPHDLDIVINNNPESIIKAIELLHKLGYNTYSWQDKIDNKVDVALLKGRYYFRGEKVIDGATYQIDINYESDVVDLNKVICKSIRSMGYNIAPLPDIKCMLESTDTLVSRALLYRLNKEL